MLPGSGARESWKPDGLNDDYSSGQLGRRDRVGEAGRIEPVRDPVARLGIGIHQETDRSALGARQGEVTREVEPDPVHLPAAEQALAQRLDVIAVEWRLLLE